MNIETIPAEVEDLLYDWQKFEIVKKIAAPIVAIDRVDLAWDEVDVVISPNNLWVDVSRTGVSQVTIHEILPGRFAAYIMDDYDYPDEDDPRRLEDQILVSAADLLILQQGGMAALITATLFREF
jgi:hypothetical protein